MINRQRRSLLVRNVLAVASGSFAGQAVVIAFSPLITRIYSPEIFGLQGLFLSLISMLSPAIALRYPMAIVTASDEAEAAQIGRLAILIAFVLSCFLCVVLLLVQAPVLILLGAEALGFLIWFLPVALFCVALQDVADFRAARLGSFRLVGLVTVAQAFITNLARVLGGLAAPVAGTLVLVTSLAPAVQALLLTIGTRDGLPKAERPTWRKSWALLRRHQDFPIYRVPSDVVYAASQSVPIILLAALFSPAAAGLYTLTRAVVNLPSNVIGTAVGNVLYARFAELARTGRPLMPLLLRSTLALLALAPVIIGLAWFAPPVFALIFGEEWREAGRYAQWMAIWAAITIAKVPAIRLAPAMGVHFIPLAGNVTLLIVAILSFFGTFWISGSAHYAVAVFSIASVVANVMLLTILFYQCAGYDRMRRNQPKDV